MGYGTEPAGSSVSRAKRSKRALKLVIEHCADMRSKRRRRYRSKCPLGWRIEVCRFAAHRMLAHSVDEDTLLVAFALLKLHEEFLAHSGVLKLLAQLHNLIFAQGQANPFHCADARVLHTHVSNDDQECAKPLPEEKSAHRRFASGGANDGEPLASEWDVMMHGALNRRKTDDNRAVLALAKKVGKVVREHQARPTALPSLEILYRSGYPRWLR